MSTIEKEKFKAAQLPANDFRTKAQVKGTQKVAAELRGTAFNCCTYTNGTACAGAGKIVTEEGVQKITCAKRTVAVGKIQKPSLLTVEEAQRCARLSEEALSGAPLSEEEKKEARKRPHKTPFGP